MEKTFERDFRALGEIFEFTGRFAAAHRIEESLGYSIDLICEELFTNMVKYGGGEGRVSISIEVRDHRLHLAFIHPGAVPFDVTDTDDVDVSKSIDDRVPGGIGLFLVRRMMDDVAYEYSDGVARVTMTKHLGGS